MNNKITKDSLWRDAFRRLLKNKIAVVGATGVVGGEMLATLAEREFPADEVVALASERSIGREVSFGEDEVLKVRDLATFDFKGIDIVLSSPGASATARATLTSCDTSSRTAKSTSGSHPPRARPDAAASVPMTVRPTDPTRD